MKNRKKVVWITGGGTGIGSELAKILVKNDWLVVISGRRIGKLEQIKRFDSNNIFSFKLDISSEKECKEVAKKILFKFKKLDLLILNAAAYNPGSLNLNNLTSIKNILNINIMGQINCISSIIQNMKKKKEGHIVFISSPAGFRGLPNAGIYGVSKSALTFLSELMYLEFQRFNIKVQVVHPGFIKTPMTEKNNFPMPFLMSPKKAAFNIYKKLSTSDFEIAFPKKLIFPMKLLSILPNKIYFYIMKNLLKAIN